MNYTILINKENKIPEDFINQLKLIKVKDVEDNEILVEEETLKAYKLFEQEMRKQGIIIGIASAYRSLEEQKEIMDEFTEKYGEEYALKTVAPVGTSEHHSGLAIDVYMMKNGRFPSRNEELYEEEEKYRKIQRYFPQFGFILRYPKEKEKLTGYPYEPWHMRYVGIELAKELTDNNLTLDEYKIVKRKRRKR